MSVYTSPCILLGGDRVKFLDNVEEPELIGVMKGAGHVGSYTNNNKQINKAH